MPITVRDVARHAGVDVATVSRALRQQQHVSAASRAKVEAAVQALGYRPLRRRRASQPSPLRDKTIGVVLLGMHHTLAALPAVGVIIQAVENALHEAGADVLHVDVPDLNTMPAAVRRGPLDAVILKSAMQGEVLTNGRALQPLRQLPSVWVTGRPRGGWGDACGADNHAVGALAAEHLLARGHRRVAIVNPKPDHALFRSREDGFRATMARAGVAVSSHAPALSTSQRRWRLPLRPVDLGEDLADLVDQALATGATALFVPADGIAALVHPLLKRRGIQPGRQVALISCNHEPELITGLAPSLTTVDIRLAEMGRLAVDLLGWRWQDRARPLIDLTVAPMLVRGEST